MSGFFQPVEQRAQPRHSVAVQICGRLIHHDYFWFHSADGCNSDKLLFSAGQWKYPPVEQPVNVHLCTHSVYSFLHEGTLQWNILHTQCNLVCCISSKKLAARILEYAANHCT